MPAGINIIKSDTFNVLLSLITTRIRNMHKMIDNNSAKNMLMIQINVSILIMSTPPSNIVNYPNNYRNTKDERTKKEETKYTKNK